MEKCIESFIQQCDDMMIADESIGSSIKTAIKEFSAGLLKKVITLWKCLWRMLRKFLQ